MTPSPATDPHPQNEAHPAEQGDGGRETDVEGLAGWLDGLGGSAAARKGYAEAAAALRSITETNRVQAAEIERLSAPIPMILHCPKCGLQHVDAPETISAPAYGLGGSVVGQRTATAPPPAAPTIADLEGRAGAALRVRRLQDVARLVLTACEMADVEEELHHYIDGNYLDMLREVLPPIDEEDHAALRRSIAVGGPLEAERSSADKLNAWISGAVRKGAEG